MVAVSNLDVRVKRKGPCSYVTSGCVIWGKEVKVMQSSYNLWCLEKGEGSCYCWVRESRLDPWLLPQSCAEKSESRAEFL